MSFKVSVALACYNGEKYIKKQLESIMCQLSDNDEVVVSDDCSEDETWKIVSEMANQDHRIKLIKGPHKGYNKNFENAIKQCTGDYIFISDQDDVWMENKVSTVLNEFDEKTNCIRHDCIVVDDNDNVLCESYLKERKASINYLRNIYKNTFTGCCMCVRRDWLNQLLPFPDGIFYDAWIGILSCKYNNAKIIDAKLIKWCRHEGTVTNVSKRNSIVWIIKDRIRLKKELKRKCREL